MTVYELQRKLEKYPDDAEIIVSVYNLTKQGRVDKNYHPRIDELYLEGDAWPESTDSQTVVWMDIMEE